MEGLILDVPIYRGLEERRLRIAPWRYPLTNAIVDGKHNRVKVLKRLPYGYQNDRTFMLRILNCIHTD